MNQFQDFTSSRFSEHAQQKQLEQQQILRRNKLFSVPISKLGYFNIFIRRDNAFIKKQLPSIQKKYSIQEFQKVRDIYELDINRFIKQCRIQQDSNKEIKNNPNSHKKLSNFNFNNWINNEQYSCKINEQNHMSLLTYYVLDLKFQKALKIMQTLPKSMELATLKIVLKGLNTIVQIIQRLDSLVQNGNIFANSFFNRSSFQMLQDNNYSIERQIKLNLLKIQFEDQNSIRKSSVQQMQMMARQSHLKVGQSSIPKKFSQENLLLRRQDKQSQQWSKLLQMTDQQKKKCILDNLLFLINFSQKLKTNKLNDYLKIVFLYLSNQIDQTETAEFYLETSVIDDFILEEQQEKQFKSGSVEYVDILLNLKDINIYDRLNFAHKLLCKGKRQIFVKKLGQKLTKLPYLNNILFYSSQYREQQQLKSLKQFKTYKQLKQFKEIRESSKSNTLHKTKSQNSKQVHPFLQKKEVDKINLFFKRSFPKSDSSKEKTAERIIKICQNYIDQYGDLQTIAYLAYEYPCLIKFNNFYRESLLLSYETAQLQKLDNKKMKHSDHGILPKLQLPKKQQPFLNYININNQKISQIKQQVPQSAKKCQICYQTIILGKGQAFIQCAKCKHGGHLSHIVRWLQSYQHCPNIDCACLCN